MVASSRASRRRRHFAARMVLQTATVLVDARELWVTAATHAKISARLKKSLCLAETAARDGLQPSCLVGATHQASAATASHRRHGLYLTKLRLGLHASHAFGEALHRGRQARQTALSRHHVASGRVVTEHDEGEDARAEYTHQGDESMYTEESLAARLALRRDPKVAYALQHFWEAALRCEWTAVMVVYLPTGWWLCLASYLRRMPRLLPYSCLTLAPCSPRGQPIGSTRSCATRRSILHSSPGDTRCVLHRRSNRSALVNTCHR